MRVATAIFAAVVVLPFSFVTASASASIQPDYVSPSGVEIFNPSDFFDATGPWSIMSRAGNTLYIAGMRGIYPENSTLAPTGLPRVRQAFNNMVTLAQMAGYSIDSCVRGK